MAARSLAQAEAELADEVRRRLRARSPAAQGWVPSAPDGPADGAHPEPPGEPPDVSCGDEAHASGELISPGPMAAADAGQGTTRSVGGRLRAALRDRVPLALRGADVGPSRTAVAGLAGLLAAALMLVLFLTWLQRPHESPLPAVRRSVPAGVVAALPPTATPAPEVEVHVAGAVRRPGLVELPQGSRVDDAVAAAGGATHRADLASVNLARRLLDGEQIVVLRKGQTRAAGVAEPPTGGSATPGQPVDLNTATVAQLDGLPGVGPVLAQRIIDWRTAHGRFSSVDELTEVSGIGERTLADIRPLVRL